MKKIIIAVCIVLAVISGIGAVTYTEQRVAFNSSLDGHTLVYIQIFSYDGTTVYDPTANSNTGGMVALASATYANTAITVVKNTEFNIWQVKFPSGTSLGGGRYSFRLMGSSDATADKDDTLLPCADFFWSRSGGFDFSYNLKSGLPLEP